MENRSLSTAIIKIELLWSTILLEKSDDPRAYEYIAVQAMALKQAVILLKADVGDSIRRSKKEKLKYQKLHSSLAAILETLDYQPQTCKDEEYILDILNKLRDIRGQIQTLLEYQ